MAQEACAHCGSRDFHRGVTAAARGNTRGGMVGLEYKETEWWGRYGKAVLPFDLCKGCGTVHRIYVRDPNLAWKTE